MKSASRVQLRVGENSRSLFIMSSRAANPECQLSPEGIAASRQTAFPQGCGAFFENLTWTSILPGWRFAETATKLIAAVPLGMAAIAARARERRGLKPSPHRARRLSLPAAAVHRGIASTACSAFFTRSSGTTASPPSPPRLWEEPPTLRGLRRGLTPVVADGESPRLSRADSS
jgi:hypothetical protein